MNDIEYKKYEKLIQRISWSFHNTTGIEYEELFSEANVIYCEAKNSFDEAKKTNFSTYLYSCIRLKFIQMINKEKLEKSKVNNIMEYNKTDISNNPENQIMKNNILSDVTEEAKEVIQIILEAPADTIKIGVNGIIDFLKKQKGYKWKKANKIVKELKNTSILLQEI